MILPGMHGIHCTKCNRLFDAFRVPSPLDDAIMRMKTIKCPKCSQRKYLLLLMPQKYSDMLAAEQVNVL